MSAPGLAWIASLDDEDLDALALRLWGAAVSLSPRRPTQAPWS
ncbi:MAG: hypothetical protein ACP5H2_09045 [Solirubrobacteraceae bacterium]